MRNTVRITMAALGLLAAAGLGCGGDGGTGPSASDVVGTWNATKVELASLEAPNMKIDGLASGGTLTMWINQDHTWQSLQTEPGEPDMWSQGTWSLKGRTLTITESGASINFGVRCDGSTMTLTANATWDYDLDGTDEPARVTMVFAK